jgi:hypothetical protein
MILRLFYFHVFMNQPNFFTLLFAKVNGPNRPDLVTSNFLILPCWDIDITVPLKIESPYQLWGKASASIRHVFICVFNGQHKVDNYVSMTVKKVIVFSLPLLTSVEHSCTSLWAFDIKWQSISYQIWDPVASSQRWMLPSWKTKPWPLFKAYWSSAGFVMLKMNGQVSQAPKENWGSQARGRTPNNRQSSLAEFSRFLEGYISLHTGWVPSW